MVAMTSEIGRIRSVFDDVMPRVLFLLLDHIYKSLPLYKTQGSYLRKVLT